MFGCCLIDDIWIGCLLSQQPLLWSDGQFCAIENMSTVAALMTDDTDFTLTNDVSDAIMTKYACETILTTLFHFDMLSKRCQWCLGMPDCLVKAVVGHRSTVIRKLLVVFTKLTDQQPNENSQLVQVRNEPSEKKRKKEQQQQTAKQTGLLVV